MKPFNLELANLGHPLITRDGRKIVQFVHYKEPYKQTADAVLSAVLDTGGRKSYLINGRFYEQMPSDADLFLDDSIPWEKPLQEGDEIEVLIDEISNTWGKRILLHIDKHGNALCIQNLHETNYNTNTNYIIMCWKKEKWRRIPTPKPQAKMDIKITINGEEKTLEEFKALIKDF
jgi:hypothetical protein